MAVTARWYPEGVLNIAKNNVDYESDTIKLALLDSNHSFNDAHDAWDDVSANEISATSGYTAEGETLGTKTLTRVDSSSATAWQASTAYSLGDIVRATTDNGHLFVCVQAGTSGGSEPTWVTDKLEDTTDNTVVWSEFGAAYISIDSAQVQWTSSTITARYGIIYKDSGTDSTSYLIGQIDFGQDESSSSGNFTVTPPTAGWFTIGAGTE